MNHADHVRLIAAGVPPEGGVWADLGAGVGAFTLALRDLAGPDVTIYAIDRDRSALHDLHSAMERHFPGTALVTHIADITGPLDLPPLDGIIAANALHFVPVARQPETLRRWRGHLGPGGRLILVEYDAEAGNRWVPNPISFRRLPALARQAGFGPPTLLGRYPSRFMDGIYAAGMKRKQEIGEKMPWAGSGIFSPRS